MTITTDSTVEKTSQPGTASALAEILLIVMVFFLYAGWPPPDANEAHYLAKAKHYWDAAWCRGDLFLESGDAHLVFFWTFGWVTRFLSLPATAWVGRVLTWVLLAWSWRRLSHAIVPRQWWSWLSASLSVCLLHHFHMAGEWIVGGVEAKGFAFVLLFLALEALVKDRWRRVWLLLGAAAAFHVLVGGWAVVAAGLAWLATRDRPSLVSMMPSLAGGLLRSLPGLVPAALLSLDAPRETAQAAHEIYVFQRLSHHLVPHAFHPLLVARHVGLLAVWLVLSWFTRSEAATVPLRRFVLGSVLIAMAGAAIDLATLKHPDVAAALLRYYWFRLSDVMLPLGASLAAVALIAKHRETRPVLAQWTAAALALVAAVGFGEHMYRRQRDPRPAAVAQSRPVVMRPWGWPFHNERISHAWANYEDWRRACRWIAENLRPDDRFLTPPGQQTFKWYAGRGETVTWKDIPQDARGLVEWQERMVALHGEGVDESGERRWISPLFRRREELLELARHYDFQYIVVENTWQPRRLPFQQVYPNASYDNATYTVYRVPASATPAEP